jgi:hypothetical protein
MALKKWTKKTEKVVRLVAEDRESDHQIAALCKISPRTLARWKSDPDFIERVAVVVTQYRERALRHGLARQDRRIRELTDVYDKLQQIVAARAKDPALEKVPGGSTGLLVRRVSSIGSGENFHPFSEYELDAALVRELRAILDQVSQECGQKVAKTELTGADGKPLVPPALYKLPFDPDTLSDEELEVMTRVYERAANGGSPTREG